MAEDLPYFDLKEYRSPESVMAACRHIGAVTGPAESCREEFRVRVYHDFGGIPPVREFGIVRTFSERDLRDYIAMHLL